MNFQDLLYPVMDGMIWTFELLMEGSPANIINWLAVVIGTVLLLGWIGMQKKYDKQAAADGTIA